MEFNGPTFISKTDGGRYNISCYSDHFFGEGKERVIIFTCQLSGEVYHLPASEFHNEMDLVTW